MLFGSAYTQIKFFKLYTDNGADFGHGIVQLEDSSYVITGSSSSFSDSPSQAFLLKVDSVGNYIWSNHYGGSEMESGRRVLYQQNFGFFICGYTNSIGNGGFDYYLAKVNENASLEWEASYGGSGWEKVHDAAMTLDTGTIMVGETSSNATDNKDMYIVRTDSNGDTLWTKTMGGPGDDFISSIRRYDDTLYALGGQKWISDSSMVKGYMALIHEDGTMYWEDTMGRSGNYWIHDIEFEGTRIVGVGGTSGENKDGIDFYFYPATFGGDALGPLEVGNPGDEDHVLITTYGPDDDFHIVSTNIDQWTFEGGIDTRVHKFLPNMAWQNGFTIGNPGPDVPGEIIRTSDGGAILVGYTTGVVSGGNEVFVAKIGPGDAVYPNPQMDLIIEAIVDVDEVEAAIGSLSVYPNPATNILQIETENQGYSEVRIVDASGKVVALENISFKLTMSLEELTTGWYLLEVSGAKMETVRRKVVVNR